MDYPLHSIGTVSRRTGLTTHTIRAWERRYAAVTPGRSEGGQRLYTETDIRRLSLLSRITDTGMAISRAAGLDESELEELIRSDRTPVRLRPAPSGGTPPLPELLGRAVDLIRSAEQAALTSLLDEATNLHGRRAVTDELIPILMGRVGDGWRENNLRIFHEHLATAAVRSYLERALTSFRPPPSAPRYLATTPTAHLHEIGALLSAAVAAEEGYRPMYLGPGTPSEEIIRAAAAEGARFVGLGLTVPSRDSGVADEIERVYRGLESGELILGGASAPWYRDIVRQRGANVRYVESVQELRNLLTPL